MTGNMQTMSKQVLQDDKSYGRIDDLTYKYNGNQVIKITDKVSGPYYKDAMHFVDGADAEIEYEYDKNGCMTKDLNKKISKIEYNLLNLPTKLNFADGSTISYSYDADGNKLRADYNLSLMNVINGTSSNAQAGNGVTTHRDYCGNFIYEDGALKMLLFDGGYVTFNSSNSPKYHFYLKDHLGNYRVVADANGNIEQVNHYYPFGGLMAESTGGVQPYKYNGKELDRMHGLDSYDYGARWMSDGRFTTPDSHAIDYVGISPYAYCGNNPMNSIDLNGEDWIKDNQGFYQFNPNINSKTKLAKGYTYCGVSFQIGKKGDYRTFRNDGSILFDNETSAYKYIWKQANYMQKEVGGFLLKNNYFLVLPDYLNNARTTKLNDYGYNFNGTILSKNKVSLKVKGQVHTHQDKTGDSQVSRYLVTSYGDLGVSVNHNSLPVFALGHDGVLCGIRGYKTSKGQVVGFPINLRKKDKSLYNLLHGYTTISSIINRLPLLIK